MTLASLDHSSGLARVVDYSTCRELRLIAHSTPERMTWHPGGTDYASVPAGQPRATPDWRCLNYGKRVGVGLDGGHAQPFLGEAPRCRCVWRRPNSPGCGRSPAFCTPNASAQRNS